MSNQFHWIKKNIYGAGAKPKSELIQKWFTFFSVVESNEEKHAFKPGYARRLRASIFLDTWKLEQLSSLGTRVLGYEA